MAYSCSGRRQGWRAASRGRLLFFGQGMGSLCAGGRDRSSAGGLWLDTCIGAACKVADPGSNSCGGAGAVRCQGYWGFKVSASLRCGVFGAHFVLAHRRLRDSGCAITRTDASTDCHGKGQTTGGFKALGNLTTVVGGNSLWCEGPEHRWGRREDPPFCSGECSRRNEVASGCARIIRVGSW
jgi:hypothetical protein